MKMKRLTVVFAVVSSLLLSVVCRADVKLPSIIGDNMVLQRDMAIPLWGHADPGEKVTVSMNNRKFTTKTGRDGKWSVRLDSMDAGGPYALTIEGDSDAITFSNILVGEVWLCSGQSNMEMMVAHCDNGPDEVANAVHPMLRLFQTTNAVSPEPLDDCEGKWKVCRPSTVGNFSAAGYFFGREIMLELDVPVGLIHSSWGGTTAETWMSIGALTSYPEFRFILYRWDEVMKERSPDVVDYFNDMGQWHEDLYHQLNVRMFADKPIVPPRQPPEAPVKLHWLPHIPTWLYNGMITPLIPYAIRGAVWYQGESNAGRAYQYRELFPALIRDWRVNWEQGDFPFVFTQISSYGARNNQPRESAWAELREAQLLTLAVPNTAMAVTIDIGEADDIHPRNKQEVGRRLALGALHAAYNRDVVYSGPIYDSMTVEDGRIRLRFRHVGGGLVASTGESLRGFAVAGADSVFVWAKAQIDGDEVVVGSDDVAEPVAVRYGWDINPECNLYNREGLPASPFRTDDWPGMTVDKK